MATTVEQLEIDYASQVAAGAAADTDALLKMAGAAETLDTTITKAGRSATSYVNAKDAMTKATLAAEAAERRLIDAEGKLGDAVANGSVSEAQRAGALVTMQKEADNARAKLKTLQDGTEASTGAVGLSRLQWGYVADDVHRAADQMAAGGGVMKAAFYQLPSIVEIMGGTKNAVGVLAGVLSGPAGLAVAAAAAGAAMIGLGAYAESQQSRLAVLSQTLRATRTDYDAVAVSATAAAKSIAQQTNIAPSDARAAVNTFAAVPQIDDSQIKALTIESANLATMLGVTVPAAATQLVDAFKDPEKAAEDFAQKGLFGVTEGLAQQVKGLQDSGQSLQAFALLNGQLQTASAGAADKGLTPFRLALDNLSHAFNDPIAGGKSLGDSLGANLLRPFTDTTNEITAMVNGLKQLKNLSIQSNGNIVITPPSAAGASVSSTINSVGASLGASADVVSLAQRIAPVESSTGQLNAQGGVVTSAAGALGAMQVMPASAGGNDLTTLTGNVTAAEQLLIRLYGKYGGDQTLVAMAYNWGEGNVDKYLAGTLSDSAIPAETSSYIAKVTDGATYSASQVAVRQQSVQAGLTPTDSSTAAQQAAAQRAIDQTIASQKSLDELRSSGNISDAAYGQQTSDLTARLNMQQAALLGLRDPMATVAHAQDLAIQLAGTYSAAELAMTQSDQQVTEAANKMGQAHASASDLEAAHIRVQAQLIGQFNQTVNAINLQTDAELKLTAGYDGSTGTLQSFTIAQQAAEKVRATSIDDTDEQARQLDILTSTMKSAAAAAADLSTKQQLFGQGQQLQYIQAETASLGQNSDAVSVQLAVLKERQALLAKDADLQSAASQADLANVAAITSSTNAYEHSKQVLTDLTGGISSAFDTLGDDITQAFVQGAGSSVTFASALQGVETQVLSLITKMALINPILNEIDGGTRTTLSDVGNLLSGSSLGGIGGTTGAGGLGSLGGLFGANSSGSGSSGGGIGSLFGLGGSSGGGAGVIDNSPGMSFGDMSAQSFGSDPFDNVGGLFGQGGTLGTGFSASSLFGSLGGIGAGIGVGSLLGGLTGKGGLTSSIGSGIGSIAGSFLGPIGSVAGGALGGLLGGLFGPGKENPGTADTVDIGKGGLSIGSTYNQAENDTFTPQLTADIASLNATFKQYGVNAVNADQGSDRLGIVGDGQGNTVSSIAALLGNLRLQSSGSGSFGQALAQGIGPDANSSVASLTAAIAQLKAMATTVDSLGVGVSKFNADGTVTVSKLTGYSGQLATALDATLDGKTLSISDLQADVATLKTMASAVDALGATVSQFNLDGSVTVKAFTGYSGDLATALSSLDGQTLNVSDLQSQVAAINTFVGTTMPALLKTTLNGTSSWLDQMTAQQAQYAAAAAQANSYGLNGQAITDSFNSQYATGLAGNLATLRGNAAGVLANGQAANGDQEASDLTNFDASALQQKSQLAASWQAVFGAGYASLAEYQGDAAQLDQTLYAQRLAIQTKYSTDALTAQQTAAASALAAQQASDAAALSQRESAAGNASTLVSGLTNFATSLATGSLSALSPQGQYKAANDAYSIDLYNAKAGNYAAIQSLQGDAQTLLGSSQTYNGSGTAYAADFQRVLSDIQSVIGVGSDALTNDSLAAALNVQTDTLTASLQTMTSKLGDILLELSQGNLRKAA